MMRVLLSCYGFSPYRGSEASVGWNIAKALSRYCDVTVICGDLESKQLVLHDLERWQHEEKNIPTFHFSYVAPTKLISFIEKLHNLPGCWALYYLAYRLWQKQAYERALELNHEKPFDLVHHVTMTGYREPGFMWKLPIPFAWGPVGGSINEPLRFWSIYSPGARFNVVLRTIVNGLQKRLLLRPRLAAHKASKIWAVTSEDEKTIRNIWGRECEKLNETASTPNPKARVHSYKSGDVLRLVWSGTHTYGKALSILVEALKRLGDKNTLVKVDVMGRGPETEKWKRLAENEGVANCFNWRGYLPHDEALSIMNDAHALAFTSVKEGTPSVVFEALSMGLPVICHDACGMGVAVTDKCGIKIPMSDPDTSINGFAGAIEKLLADLDLLSTLSKGALERAAELTWDGKAQRIFSAYQDILKQ